jgi:hypothetical protein
MLPVEEMPSALQSISCKKPKWGHANASRMLQMVALNKNLSPVEHM